LKSYTSKKTRTEIENSDYESRKGWMMWDFANAGIKYERFNDFRL
jgi:hypothetical protein